LLIILEKLLPLLRIKKLPKNSFTPLNHTHSFPKLEFKVSSNVIKLFFLSLMFHFLVWVTSKIMNRPNKMDKPEDLVVFDDPDRPDDPNRLNHPDKLDDLDRLDDTNELDDPDGPTTQTNMTI